MPIQIQLNGEIKAFESPLNLVDLLESLQLKNPYFAVAMNDEIVSRADFDQRAVQNGDKIDIIKAVAGG